MTTQTPPTPSPVDPSTEKQIASRVPPPEDQRTRWVRYGANVVLSSIIVILIAVAVVYLGDKRPRRLDTTLAGAYSLTPQTRQVISNLTAPIRIISLYTRAKPSDEQAEESPEITGLTQEQKVERVDDLLQEYSDKGKNITVESIDPNAAPNKVEDLINQVSSQYGGQIKIYKDYINGFGDKLKQLTDLANAQVAQVEGLPIDKIQSDELQQAAGLALVTVREVPPQLTDLTKAIQKPLHQNPPDYKGAADSLTNGMSVMSSLLGPVIDAFNKLKSDPQVPVEIRSYMTTNLPNYQKMKDIADGVVKQGDALGDLKLDTLRQSLKVRDPILVMGGNDWRVLTPSQIWQAQTGGTAGTANGPAVRFAGEQQITGAILALSMPSKPRVVFCRTAGGPPLTDPGMEGYQQAGPFAAVAARLQTYDFEVQEKDLSGTYAMQAQQQGQQAAPEASDADLNDKNTVWVVLATTSATDPMSGAPITVGPKIAAHLAAGGSVLLVTQPQSPTQQPGEDFNPILKDWGIELLAGIEAVHETVPTSDDADQDVVSAAQSQPVVFTFTNYGDHPLAKPLRSLEGLMGLIAVVNTHHFDGVNTTPLLPIPGAPEYPKAWGDANLDQLQQDMQNRLSPTFQPDKGDIPEPIFGGAVAEKEVAPGSSEPAGRLVVIGTPTFMDSQLVTYSRNHVLVFPGNGELFNNCVFWLAHMDQLLAISPAAMDVNRIEEISPPMMRVWQIAVLVGIPLAVGCAGVMMYLSRQG
jgi:hypothetical protein